MIDKLIKYLLLALILFSYKCYAQYEDTLVIAFWNLENLFDTIDDSAKNDEDFLPGGEMQWTDDRLNKKMYNLSKVIQSINDGNGPDILGVCEVENQAVLENMVNNFLSDLKYEVAYIESPDNRGIDNGLVYKKDKFKLLNVQADTVHLSDGFPTRLIFGANLLTQKNLAITVFVNHWPSRRGGQSESEQNRIDAAKTLRNAVDRIFGADSIANIFIAGDFNDDPVNVSVLEILRAHPIKCDSLETEYRYDTEGELFNLAYEVYQNGDGSFKYKDTWNMLDQLIVSENLITGEGINYLCNSFEVYKPEFMVTHSGEYKGTPFPTFGGMKYLGGYSDHFPVIAKFLIKGSN